jgi:hypothetical protein
MKTQQINKAVNQAWRAMTPIQKAEISRQYLFDNGGLLVEGQQQSVIMIMQKVASILGVANIQPMSSHTERLDTMRFTGRVTRRGNECEVTDTVRPTLKKPTLRAETFRAVVEASYDSLEDSVGGPDDFVDKMLNALTSRMVTDIEELLINGNTGSADPYLQAWDGMLASATSHIYDATLARFTKDVANDLINTLPTEYRKNRAGMRFFLDHNSEQYARSTDAGRATGYGDSQLVNNNPVEYFGVPLLASDVWPNDLGPGTNQTEVILTATENIGVGVWREMRLEQEPNPKAQCISFVLSARVAFTYLEEDAVAKAINVLAQ